MDDYDYPDSTDLEALGRLQADVAPPTDDVLVAARLRLTAAMGTDVLSRPQLTALRRPERTVRSAPRASARPRFARRAAVGVAAAVALGLGAYALTGQDPAAHQSAPRGPATPGVRAATPPSSEHPTPAPHYVTVAQLLDAASSAALRTAVPAGGYTHTTNHSLSVSSVDDPPNNGAYAFGENRREQWQPARTEDAGYQHDITNISVTAPTAEQRRYLARSPGGLTEESDTWYRTNPDGSQTPIYPQGGTEPACSGTICASLTAWDGPTPGLTTALPTATSLLRANLFAWANAQHADAAKYGKPTTVAAIALKGVGFVLDSGYASAALRSALFQVAKTIPGIDLNGSMANYDGVRGLAVSTTDPFDVQQNLIFATDGSGYIGERDVVVHPSREYLLTAGTVITWTSVTTDVTGRPTLPKGARTGG